MDCGGGSLPNGQLVRGFFDNSSSKPAEVNDFYCVTQLPEYKLKTACMSHSTKHSLTENWFKTLFVTLRNLTSDKVEGVPQKCFKANYLLE